MYRVPKWLMIAISVASLSSFMSFGSAYAQESDESLIAVCVSSFESPIYVWYLTEDEITEINQLVQDPAEPPVPEIVGYPDPETGSCATENGELIDYDPEFSTPVCLPSGPENEGPLVVVLVSNHYLPGYILNDVVLADPVTGACPDQDSSDPAPDDEVIEALIAVLVDILREILT